MDKLRNFLVLVLIIGCTPASMPVTVAPITPRVAPTDTSFGFSIDAESFARATDVIGDPAILGYPIDAREALLASTNRTFASAFPRSSLSSDIYPRVHIRLQDFDVSQDVSVSGAMSHRFTAAALVTLRVDLTHSGSVPPQSVSLTSRKSASASGVADRMEREFPKLISEAIQLAIADVLTQVAAEVTTRIIVP